jgi:hypothetical protein
MVNGGWWLVNTAMTEIVCVRDVSQKRKVQTKTTINFSQDFAGVQDI